MAAIAAIRVVGVISVAMPVAHASEEEARHCEADDRACETHESGGLHIDTSSHALELQHPGLQALGIR